MSADATLKKHEKLDACEPEFGGVNLWNEGSAEEEYKFEESRFQG